FRVLHQVVELSLRSARLRLLGVRHTEPARAEALAQFPVTLANREHSAVGMMHQRLATFPAAQHGQEALAVLASVGGYFRANHISAGRHQVVQADQLIADGAGLDLPGPANQQRNAMAGLPDIRLLPAPAVARAVAEF